MDNKRDLAKDFLRTIVTAYNKQQWKGTVYVKLLETRTSTR